MDKHKRKTDYVDEEMQRHSKKAEQRYFDIKDYLIKNHRDMYADDEALKATARIYAVHTNGLDKIKEDMNKNYVNPNAATPVGDMASVIRGLDGPNNYNLNSYDEKREPSEKPKRNIFSADPRERHPEAYDFGENLLGR